MRAALALSMVVLVALVSACQSGSSPMWRWPVDSSRELAARAPTGRLPEGVDPLRYRLRLRVDPQAERFEGEVEIDLRIAAPTSEIWLHGSRLQLRSAVVERAASPPISARYREVEISGVAHLALEEELDAGLATLRLAFDAPFDRAIDGLYRVDVGGRSYAFTQFEAIRARRAFPSFDEPRFKIPFDLVLEVRAGQGAFANTPVRERSPAGEGFERVVFETTPPIPTYLLAFAVGDFDVVEHTPIPPNAIRDRAVPLRGLATAGKGDRLAYALEHTAGILEALEGYVGSPYPYAKLDLVAVPDFAFGAMENAGLITYREILLLLDEHPALAQERSYASVHAHELAHQWFGNLVTMRWWDDIWLNESFATWMGNRAVDLWNPTLEFGRQTVRSGHEVMGWDIYASSRRIREPVAGSEEIATAFDPISYAKGGAVIGMLEGWVGAESFEQGIRGYLSRHAWGNATADDWIAAIEEVSGGEAGSVTRVAHSFLDQPGVPRVQARLRCEGSRATLELSQERYLPIGSALSPDRRWSVPVCFRVLAEDRKWSEQCVLLERDTRSVALDGAGCPAALALNRDGKGYYRVASNQGGWRGLLANFGALSAGEQLAATSDLEAELRAGGIDVYFYLEAIASILRPPKSQPPSWTRPGWDVVSQPFDAIRDPADSVAEPAQRAEIAQNVGQIYEALLGSLGPESGAEAGAGSDVDAGGIEERLLRERILRFLAVDLRVPAHQQRMAALATVALDEGAGISGTARSNHEAVDPDLLGPALSSAVDAGDGGFFERLRARFESSSEPAFRSKALFALARTTHPGLRAELLGEGFLGSLRTQEWSTLFFGAMSRPENRRPVFDWYRANFGTIRAALPESYLARAPHLFGSFCDLEARAEVEAFFAPWISKTPGLERALSQSLEGIEHCAAARRALTPVRIPES